MLALHKGKNLPLKNSLAVNNLVYLKIKIKLVEGSLKYIIYSEGHQLK